MKDINLHTEDQGSFQLLIDPVYGPDSKYFWPGRYTHARSYITDPTRPPVYVSGQEFLEEYAEEFSGVLDYRESTFYPERSYCETLYEKFDSLYNDVESWDSTTLFASAVYRGLFHEMFPYQSELLDYELISETDLKKGVDDEAIFAAFGRRVKESDKVKRNLSSVTCLSVNGINLISLYRSFAYFRADGSIKADQYCGNSSKTTHKEAFGRIRLYPFSHFFGRS